MTKMTDTERSAVQLRCDMFDLKSAYEAELACRKIAETNDQMRELWSEYAMLMGDKLLTAPTKLPTKDEYNDYRHRIVNGSDISCEWSEPLYICPLCGGAVRRNDDYALTSFPPQFLYKCDKCGHKEFGE